MKTQLKLFIVLGACSLMTGGVSAALLDDFETAGADDNPGGAFNTITEPSGVSVSREVDSSEFFAQGASNHYASIVDGSGSNGAILLAEIDNLGGKVSTVSFLFYDPNEGESPLVMRISNNNTGGQTTSDIRIGDQGVSNGGGAAVLEGVNVFNAGELVEINVITNDTGSSLDDYFGANDLGSGKIDVWVTTANGVSTLVVDEGDYDNGFNAGNNPNMDTLFFSSFSGSQGTWFVDDVHVDESALVGFIIPEPASLTLIGLVGVLCMMARLRG